MKARPNPIDVYWPPDDGYPRLKWMSHEILWLLAQDRKNQEIIKLTGCHKSYVSLVKKRYKLRGESFVLTLLRSLEWPLEP